ncbi:MAG: zf-HC2 domain-containing protein [Bryobacteraceae bacterium]
MNEPDCNTIFSMLSEYVDQSLPPATCEEFERHIKDCATCVAFVESLRKSVRLCRDYRSEAEVPDISPAVKQSLKEAYERMVASREKALEPE